MYQRVIRPLLFLLKPETVHNLVFMILSLAERIPGILFVLRSFYQVKDDRLSRDLFGLHFSSPVGLAAGLDKDSQAFESLHALGFAFVEIGTVTPKAQPGNPKPRLFRLKKDQALINRMGFNNKGVDYAYKRLQNRSNQVIIGGNIGKNKITSNEEAISDYLISFRKLFPVVDYFAINVSSPNTPNLRDLQDKEPLMHLLNALQAENAKQDKRKPILLKIAPDLTDNQLDDIIEIVQQTKIDGVIASNTTITRPQMSTPVEYVEAVGAGGLSGKPLLDRSTEVVRYLHNADDQMIIVGVGGIMTAQDALEKLEAGASLIQLYTGFIYEGPLLLKKIKRAILASKI